MNKVFLLAATILLSPFYSLAQQGCSGNIVLASASTWSNLSNSKDSLKFQTSQVIKEATQNKTKADFSISSIPNKYLSNYKDKEYCAQKLKETSGNNRLVYQSPDLKSSDAVNDWISGFSQGKSDAGAALYTKCDRSCSPAYEYQVSFDNNIYRIKALVTCGHARDKDDNKYKVKAICKS